MKRNKAFTLIELLVVIAIIALLAAILFPVFGRAKVAAKKTVEISNAREDLLGAVMYCDDNDEYLVPLQSSPGGYNDVFTPQPWTLILNYDQIIFPYTKSFAIYRNPLDPNATDSVLWAGGTTSLEKEFNETQRSDHGYNFIYLSPLNFALYFIPVSASSITRPSQTIHTVDSVWATDGGGNPTGGGSWLVQAPSYQNSNTASWFGFWNFNQPAGPGSSFEYGFAWDYDKGHVIFAFEDGHTKVEPTQALWAGADPTTGTVTNWDEYLWGGQPN